MKIRTSDGDTVPHLIWSHFQRSDDVAEELVYAHNTGLEKYGEVLPSGIIIEFPDFPELPEQTVVNLWD